MLLCILLCVLHAADHAGLHVVLHAVLHAIVPAYCDLLLYHDSLPSSIHHESIHFDAHLFVCLDVGRCMHVGLQVIGVLRRLVGRLGSAALSCAQPLRSIPSTRTPLARPPPLGLLGSPRLGNPLGSEPSLAPILVTYSSAALVLGA